VFRSNWIKSTENFVLNEEAEVDGTIESINPKTSSAPIPRYSCRHHSSYENGALAVSAAQAKIGIGECIQHRIAAEITVGHRNVPVAALGHFLGANLDTAHVPQRVAVEDGNNPCGS